MWYLGLVYSLYGFSYIIYMTFFAAYLVKEMGWKPGAASALWALVGGVSIFCGVLWGGSPIGWDGPKAPPWFI